jgi:outer membrane protein assembly factor BamE
MRSLLVLAASASLLSLAGCSTIGDAIPDALESSSIFYRIPIQQGNMVEQESVNQLQPGMDKRQVRHIMGTPMLVDPFHQQRWDYIYRMRPSRGETEQRRVALFFEGDQLVRIEGDLRPEPGGPVGRPRDTVVEVPDYGEGGPSLVDKAMGAVGLGK